MQNGDQIANFVILNSIILFRARNLLNNFSHSSYFYRVYFILTLIIASFCLEKYELFYCIQNIQ